METKKSASKNLERKRGLFFQIGLVASLSLALLAFQYTTPKLIPTVKNAKVKLLLRLCRRKLLKRLHCQW